MAKLTGQGGFFNSQIAFVKPTSATNCDIWIARPMSRSQDDQNRPGRDPFPRRRKRQRGRPPGAGGHQRGRLPVVGGHGGQRRVQPFMSFLMAQCPSFFSQHCMYQGHMMDDAGPEPTVPSSAPAAKKP